MRVKLLNDNCMPYRANVEDAGMDLRTDKEVVLRPGEYATINTGVKMKIPEGNFGLVAPRSGLGSKGLNLRNTLGIIDAGYIGEIFINVINNGSDYIILGQYERVFQLVIVPFTHVLLEIVDELEKTARGENGFGSSGTH